MATVGLSPVLNDYCHRYLCVCENGWWCELCNSAMWDFPGRGVGNAASPYGDCCCCRIVSVASVEAHMLGQNHQKNCDNYKLPRYNRCISSTEPRALFQLPSGWRAGPSRDSLRFRCTSRHQESRTVKDCLPALWGAIYLRPAGRSI